MNLILNKFKMIIFVISIFGIIFLIVLCNVLIEYVNGKYGDIVWKNFGVVWIGNVFFLLVICNISKIIVIVLLGLFNNDIDV